MQHRLIMSQKERDARQKLVHPKFIERWARRFLEISKNEGRAVAIRKMNELLNPDDAEAVGRAARELRNQYPPPA